MVYSDESFTTPIQECNNGEEKSFTRQHKMHTPSGFCLYIVPFDKDIKLSNGPLVYTIKKKTKMLLEYL